MPTPTHTPFRTAAPGRRPLAAMVIGLVLNVIAALAPLADIATVDTLSEHVRAAYPAWGPALVAGDRNAMVIYLVITGSLGVLIWIGTLWAVAAGRRWARIAVTLAFAAGGCLALVNLTMPGGAYDIILPHTYGVLTLLPSIAGLAAVVAVWRNRSWPSRS